MDLAQGAPLRQPTIDCCLLLMLAGLGPCCAEKEESGTNNR